MMVAGEVRVVAQNTAGARVGDTVTVESATSRVLGAAILVYAVPFLLFFLGYFACAAAGLGSGVSAAAGCLGFAAGVLLAILMDRRVRRRRAITFHITAINPPED